MQLFMVLQLIQEIQINLGKKRKSIIIKQLHQENKPFDKKEIKNLNN